MPARLNPSNPLIFKPASVFPSPRDWRDQFIYFLLVDRFDNSQTNPQAYNPNTAKLGRDPEQGKIFQGGNLKGVLRQLDYIKSLGCTAVWLSPIFKNRQEFKDSYHGYGIQDFLEVDPRFGTKQDLKALVQACHDRTLAVVLDIVVNHSGDNWAYPGDQPYFYWKDAPGPFDFGFWRAKNRGPGFGPDDAVWPKELQSPDAFKRRGQIRNWNDPDEAVNGDFCSLKELAIPRPEVLSTLIDAYKYWIGFADIDGFRLDTSDLPRWLS